MAIDPLTIHHLLPSALPCFVSSSNHFALFVFIPFPVSGMEENLELAILLRNSEENAKLFCKTFELVKDKAQSQG